MKKRLRRIRNSQGMVPPERERGALELRWPADRVRQGWAKAAKQLAEDFSIFWKIAEARDIDLTGVHLAPRLVART
jgi:hypothetical protein